MSESSDWEDRLSALWKSVHDFEGDAFLAQMEVLVSELPSGSAIAAFERASVYDAFGDVADAVPLYRQAIAMGLHGSRRREAAIQLASSLRNLGHASESVAVLRTEAARCSDGLDDAVQAFLALALADAGREREAVAIALSALAPHLLGYQRAIEQYASLAADH